MLNEEKKKEICQEWESGEDRKIPGRGRRVLFFKVLSNLETEGVEHRVYHVLASLFYFYLPFPASHSASWGGASPSPTQTSDRQPHRTTGYMRWRLAKKEEEEQGS